MAYPKHPDTVLIENDFYPSGLREIDVYQYYQRFRGRILEEVVGRDLMFYIAVDLNKFIIRRAGKETKYIRLTSSNWDDEIHGRVVGIHSAMKRTEDIAVVDIDSDKFDIAKQAAFDGYKVLSKRTMIIDDIQVRFTGKGGFHLFCKLNKRISIDSIRLLFKKILSTAPELGEYTVEYKRTPGKANFDLAPNKFRGNFITLYSLSTTGLRCMEVKVNALKSFKREMAKII